MKDILQQIGLSEKEAAIYQILIEIGEATASLVAQKTKESRTNTYMILERLEKDGLIKTDDHAKVKLFQATDPHNLKTLLLNRQTALRQQEAVIANALPQLTSIFNLGQRKPGMIYFEGIKGYKTLLEDMSNSKTIIDIIGSSTGPKGEARELLQKGTAKRKARGIQSRLIFNKTAENWPHIHIYPKRGLDVAFWGDEELEGEIVLYDNKVAFTVYEPSIIVAVMTNDIISKTFRSIFEYMWQSAKKLNMN